MRRRRSGGWAPCRRGRTLPREWRCRPLQHTPLRHTPLGSRLSLPPLAFALLLSDSDSLALFRSLVLLHAPSLVRLPPLAPRLSPGAADCRDPAAYADGAAGQPGGPQRKKRARLQGHGAGEPLHHTHYVRSIPIRSDTSGGHTRGIASLKVSTRVHTHPTIFIGHVRGIASLKVSTRA